MQFKKCVVILWKKNENSNRNDGKVLNYKYNLSRYLKSKGYDVSGIGMSPYYNKN